MKYSITNAGIFLLYIRYEKTILSNKKKIMVEKEKLNLGQILKEKRNELKYSQSDIAELVKISKVKYQKYEYNLCRPNLETTMKIFYFLQISFDKITDEFMEYKKTTDFNLSKISREEKYSSFIRNNFYYTREAKE